MGFSGVRGPLAEHIGNRVEGKWQEMRQKRNRLPNYQVPVCHAGRERTLTFDLFLYHLMQTSSTNQARRVIP